MSECKRIQQLRTYLEQLKLNPDYYWDEEEEGKFRRFLKRVKHWKGPFAGQEFNPAPWQMDLFYLPILCLKEKGTNDRVISTCLLFIARKNGKSFSVSVLTLYLLFSSKGGDEFYIAATKSEQARIIFDDCGQIIEQNSLLKRKSKVLANHIKFKTSKIKPLPGTTKSLDGLNPSMMIVDELHKVGYDLFGVVTSGSCARDNSLMLYATTAGATKAANPCADEYLFACELLDGEIEDHSYLPIIFEADESLDWTSEEALQQANPNLSILNKKKLKSAKTGALIMGSKKTAYERYYLNRWRDTSGEAWFESDHINSIMTNEKKRIPASAKSYGGLDISSTTDFTAFAQLFDLGEILFAKIMYWLPEMNLAERTRLDKIPYDLYKKQGYLQTTPGNVIDTRVITKAIIESHEKHPLVACHYDPAYSFNLTPVLQENDIDVFEFRQTLGNYDAPCKQLELKILEQNILLEYNPLTALCFANTRMFYGDNGMQKPDKKTRNKNQIHIDGVVGLTFSMDALMKAASRKKEEPDMEFLRRDFQL
jgi:phage terminase large subunit-like protein